MLNVCYRGCRQLFPDTKIVENDLMTAEKINFEVGSKILLKNSLIEKKHIFAMEINEN